MSGNIKVRYKSPKRNGVMTFDRTATVENLVLQISFEMGTEDFDVRYGWPPKAMDLKAKDVSLSSLNMHGETLTIIMDRPDAAEPPSELAKKKAEDEESAQRERTKKIEITRKKKEDPGDVVIPWPDREGALVLRVMPDDNSCLFTAFGGVFQKENPSVCLRQEVAGAILSSPDIYNEVVLEMSPERYSTTILDPDRWGGAIELGILSDLYDIEICSVDVKSGRVDRYGEEKSRRCILCYSGIHYDRMAFSFCSPPHTHIDLPIDVDVTTWEAWDDEVLGKAVELAQKLRDLHYFTDTTEFVLRCDVPGCGWMGEGARQAQEHMKDTGHTELSEMEIT